MAQARGFTRGSVYSRITGLLKAGGMKWEDRPLWYDIYAAFPPRYDSVYNKHPVVTQRVTEIIYPEDVVRVRFYETFGSPGILNLNTKDASQFPVRRFMDTYYRIAEQTGSTNEDEIFNMTARELGLEIKPKKAETFAWTS